MKTQTVGENVYEIVDEWARNEIDRVSVKVDRTLAGAIVQSAQGENIVVSDSSDDYLRNLKVFGKTTQVVTTGKNLFDINNILYGELLSDGDLRIQHGINDFYKFPFKENTQYTLSAFVRNEKYDSGNVRLCIVYTDGIKDDLVLLNRNTTYAYETYTSKAGKTIDKITAYYGATGSMYIKGGKLQIEEGTVATDYEPYTGGMPAPSPEYPQELVSVGDGGSVEVGLYGKNLLPYPYMNSTVTSNGITFTDNGDGTIKISGATSDSKAVLWLCKNLTLPSGTYIFSFDKVYGVVFSMNKNGKWFIDMGERTTFTVEENDVLAIYVQVLDNKTVNTVTKPMIHKQKITEDTYEPYTEQTLTLTTPNGLPGIPVTDASLATYTDADGQMWCCDEIDLERGVYVQRVKTVVYDGDENFGEETYNNYKRFYYNAKDSHENYRGATLLCSHFIAGNSAYNACRISSDGYLLLYVSESTQDYDATQFKAWLAENPTTVQYILATPIETALPDEEIAAYKSLHSNYPNTTVLNDAGAYMQVDYNADTKRYIDNKFAEMMAAIATTNAQLIS